MDNVPNPARITFSLLNGYHVTMNLGPIATPSTGVFRLYNRCPTGWCFTTRSPDGQNAQVATTVSSACAGSQAAVAGVGTPAILSSTAFNPNITTPSTGLLYSMYGQYRDSSCRAILRVAFNAAGQTSRTFWVRQVTYAASGAWGIGPSTGLRVTAVNGQLYTVDMGEFPSGVETTFKLFFLVSGTWTEPSDYTYLSGACLPPLQTAPVVTGPMSYTPSTASWGTMFAPFGAQRDAACNVVAQIAMNSGFGPLQQVYVIKQANIPLDRDPYAAYALVRNQETVIVSLGVIPQNSTTLQLFLPAAENASLWPVPGMSFTVGAQCVPSGIGVGAVFWYSQTRRRELSASSAASPDAALTPAQLSAAFRAALSATLGLSPEDIAVTVSTLPALDSPQTADDYAAYEMIAAPAPPIYWSGIDDSTGKPFPPELSASIGAITGKPVVPAYIAAGELPPLDPVTGVPTAWTSAAGVPSPPSSSMQITVHVTLPDAVLAQPRAQWNPALRAVFADTATGAEGSDISGAAAAAALTAAMASPAFSRALEAEGVPSSTVTLPSPSSDSGNTWVTPSGTTKAGGGGSTSEGQASPAGPNVAVIAGATIGSVVLALLIAGAVLAARCRRTSTDAATAAAIRRKVGPSAADAGSSRADDAADAIRSPCAVSDEPSPSAQSPALTHIVTGSTSPTSKRFTAGVVAILADPASSGHVDPTSVFIETPLPAIEAPAQSADSSSVDSEPRRASAGAFSELPAAASLAVQVRSTATPVASPSAAAATLLVRSAVVPIAGGTLMPEASEDDPEPVPAQAPASKAGCAVPNSDFSRRVLEEDMADATDAGSAVPAIDTKALLFTRSFKSPGRSALASSTAAAATWALSELDAQPAPAAPLDTTTARSDDSVPNFEQSGSLSPSQPRHPLAVPSPGAAGENGATGFDTPAPSPSNVEGAQA